jgi:hypothetical protein
MIAEQKRMTEVREGSFSAFRDGRRQGLFFLTLGVQLFLLVYQLRNELMKTLVRPLVGLCRPAFDSGRSVYRSLGISNTSPASRFVVVNCHMLVLFL